MAVIEKLNIGPLGHGTGPFWDNKTYTLFVSDLATGYFYAQDYLTKKTIKNSLENQPVSFVIPIFGEPYNFICGEGTKIKKFNWTTSTNSINNIKILDSVPGNYNHIHVGKCDACGHLWFGTAEDAYFFQGAQGALYSYRNCKGIIKQDYNINITSGITWNSQNNKLFLTDSKKTTIDCYDFNILGGTLDNKQEVFHFHRNNLTGYPNGITLDQKGHLWVACNENSLVINVDIETGKLLSSIKLPTNHLTSVAFGGRGLEELYVTSAESYTSANRECYGDAGFVYKITNLNVRGTRLHEFVPD